MTPITDLHQATVDVRFTTDPAMPVRRYWDYWGTQVTAFDITEPHDRLVLSSSAVVETEDAPPPPRRASWEDLTTPAVVDEHAEMLAPTATPRTTTSWRRRAVSRWPSTPIRSTPCSRPRAGSTSR